MEFIPQTELLFTLKKRIGKTNWEILEENLLGYVDGRYLKKMILDGTFEKKNNYKVQTCKKGNTLVQRWENP